ncbi:hypothetical protein J6590_047003 [Homalodisca vitripennis]|nr:hypothetical protein J6590_047003 [Homalodisca vitripennis]
MAPIMLFYTETTIGRREATRVPKITGMRAPVLPAHAGYFVPLVSLGPTKTEDPYTSASFALNDPGLIDCAAKIAGSRDISHKIPRVSPPGHDATFRFCSCSLFQRTKTVLLGLYRKIIRETTWLKESADNENWLNLGKSNTLHAALQSICVSLFVRKQHRYPMRVSTLFTDVSYTRTFRKPQMTKSSGVTSGDPAVRKSAVVFEPLSKLHVKRYIFQQFRQHLAKEDILVMTIELRREDARHYKHVLHHVSADVSENHAWRIVFHSNTLVSGVKNSFSGESGFIREDGKEANTVSVLFVDKETYSLYFEVFSCI